MTASKKRDEQNATGSAAKGVGEMDLRTAAALRRTVLANERTFSAWLRTGMAAIGVGMAGPKLLANGQARVVAIWMGIILILVGASVSILAASRYYKVARQLDPDTEDLTPPWMMIAIVAALMVVSILAIVLVLME